MNPARPHEHADRPPRPAAAGAAQPPPVKKPKFRWLRRAFWSLAVLIALAYLVGPMVLAPILRVRLQSMVSEHLNARLTMDRLSYDFPYGLRAHNAALIADDERGQPIDLLRVKQLQLSLAKLPFGDGPLLIEKIIADQPSGHLILTPTGFVGARGLVKEETLEQIRRSKTHPAKPGKEKPSDYFRLRRFEIHDGQVIYEDRRQPGALPWAIWKNLAVELDTTPTSGSLYKYELTARNAPLAVASVRGQFDVDTLQLDVAQFVLALKVERDKPQEQLPPRLQAVIKDYGIAGMLSISGSGQMPLRDPSQSSYQAVLDLPDASARVAGGSGGRLDRLALKVHVTSQERAIATREIERAVSASEVAVANTEPTSRPATAATTRRAAQPPTLVQLDLLDVSTGDTTLHAEKAQATIDPASDQWRVNDLLCRLDVGRDRSGLPTAVEQALGKLELSGKLKLTATAAGPLRPAPGLRLADQIEFQVIAYPRDLTVKPPKWPAPFTGVTGTVRANREVITFENVEGAYHEDKYFVNTARIPLANVERELRIQEITGSMQLTGKVEDYPKPFDFTAKQFHPSGTWYALGSFARKKGLPPGVRPDYRFDIRTDEGGGAITAKRIPLTDVKAEIVIATDLIELKRIEARSLGGQVTAEGQIAPGKPKEFAYHGTGWVRDVDLKALARYVAVEGGKRPSRLSGKGNVNVRIDGTGASEGRTAADNFRAAGRFEALDGDFWSVPVVGEVAGNTRVAPDALTAGQAAAVFDIHDQRVDLTQVAISSPVLGVQGSGAVGFDGKLDLRVVAAPLADWKDQMKRTKIPILSDVAGEVLGGLQAMINTASKTLLYEFRVSGTTKEPKIETVPTPVLTDNVAKLFGAMIKGEKLGDAIGGNPRK